MWSGFINYLCIKSVCDRWLQQNARITVFPKGKRSFIEFSEFKKSDKSLKHELWSIHRSSLSPVPSWHCDSMLVSRQVRIFFSATVFYKFCGFFRIHSGKTRLSTCEVLTRLMKESRTCSQLAVLIRRGNEWNTDYPCWTMQFVSVIIRLFVDKSNTVLFFVQHGECCHFGER